MDMTIEQFNAIMAQWALTMQPVLDHWAKFMSNVRESFAAITSHLRALLAPLFTALAWLRVLHPEPTRAQRLRLHRREKGLIARRKRWDIWAAAHPREAAKCPPPGGA